MRLESETNILEAAHLAIYNMEKEEMIRQQMEAYGFTPARIQTGKTLLANARSHQQEQSGQYEAQWSLTRQLKAEMKQLNPRFKEHAKVVQIAFRRKPEVIHTLKIDRLEPRGWPMVRQADYFYTKLLELDLKLDHYGISRKEIQQSSAAVKALLHMKVERTLQKGLAENSTQVKQQAFQELRGWVTEFRNIARIAFRQNPQLLEVFGMPVTA